MADDDTEVTRDTYRWDQFYEDLARVTPLTVQQAVDAFLGSRMKAKGVHPYDLMTWTSRFYRRLRAVSLPEALGELIGQVVADTEVAVIARKRDAMATADGSGREPYHLCWQQPTDDRQVACDRMARHDGKHSWEWETTPSPEPSPFPDYKGDVVAQRGGHDDWVVRDFNPEELLVKRVTSDGDEISTTVAWEDFEPEGDKPPRWRVVSRARDRSEGAEWPARIVEQDGFVIVHQHRCQVGGYPEDGRCDDCGAVAVSHQDPNLLPEADLMLKALCWKQPEDEHIACDRRRGHLGDCSWEVARKLERAEAMADKLAVAIRLTQEYLGDDVLPRLPGWSWYDALTEYEGSPPDPPTRCSPVDLCDEVNPEHISRWGFCYATFRDQHIRFPEGSTADHYRAEVTPFGWARVTALVDAEIVDAEPASTPQEPAPADGVRAGEGVKVGDVFAEVSDGMPEWTVDHITESGSWLLKNAEGLTCWAHASSLLDPTRWRRVEPEPREGASPVSRARDTLPTQPTIGDGWISTNASTPREGQHVEVWTGDEGGSTHVGRYRSDGLVPGFYSPWGMRFGWSKVRSWRPTQVSRARDTDPPLRPLLVEARDTISALVATAVINSRDDLLARIDQALDATNERNST